VFGGSREQVAGLLHVSTASATEKPVAVGQAAAHTMGLWPYSQHLDIASRTLSTDWWASAEDDLFGLLHREAQRAEIDADVDVAHRRRSLGLWALMDAWPRVIGSALRCSGIEQCPEPAAAAGPGEYLIVHAGVAYRDGRDDKIIVAIRSAKPIQLSAAEAARLCAAGAVVPFGPVERPDLTDYRCLLRIPECELPDGSTQSERERVLARRGLLATHC
jgi:hypothetical protein